MALTSNAIRLTTFASFHLPSFPQIKSLTLVPTKKLGFFRTFSHRTMTASMPVQVKEKIDLTDKEKKIFDRLLHVIRHFKLDTQLRVAGGWVRDKLLGKDCSDIDIALDDMLGREFCEKVNEYLSHVGEEKQGVGVIQCNPDQSKHLETARMRILDTWIDFVNLRSETYVQNSRIPTMKFGTAEEDAYRRDLTINSMFYNINNDSVEDLTGRGMSDLKSGIIVTPLPPKTTFLDDPLRVLRAIRFGARFGFVLDEELKTAAADEEVKAAIADKISRERIGHEIDLMLSGNQPVKAVTYICDLQLFCVVFCLPHISEPAVTEGYDRLCVSYMDAAWNVLQLVGFSILTDEQRRLYLYGSLFLPLRNSVYIDNKSKKIPVVSSIFRNSLKLKASDADTVINLHGASERFISLIPFMTSNGDTKIVQTDLVEENLDVPLPSRRRILAGLDNVWEMKPLLDGKAIMNIVQLKTGGPQVREWQQKVLKWQLAHPCGTADECLDWIRESQAKRAKLV
ncbi:polynucleotide adenylyltransferase family protein isoform X2 [Tasmannia lanceolata]|uniref:polynucleotide adenylyltransferase family protein isoform X2 n=1 Tax=Tasmannia lanceolata TaxID=3420 RepID=UPI004063C8C0